MKILINTGSSVVGFFQETGKISIFIVHIFKAAFSRWYLKNIFTQLLSIGYLSLPVVALTSFFTGGALAIQIYYGGNQFNSEIIVSSIFFVDGICIPTDSVVSPLFSFFLFSSINTLYSS